MIYVTFSLIFGFASVFQREFITLYHINKYLTYAF